MRILVADDELIVQKVMRSFLEKNKFEVETVESGQKAYEILTGENAPNVAIIDWMMPNLSGPEVCAKIRKARLRIRPYLLILTSKNTKEDLSVGLDAGADDFLTKPFNPAEMLARLRVAERMVAFSTEVTERVEELEELVERHQMLGDLISRPAQGAAPATDETAPTEAPAVLETPPEIKLTQEEISAVTVRALRELGLDATKWAGSPPSNGSRRVTYSAWSGLVVHPNELWMDLLLETEPAAANKIFEQAMHRTPNPSQCQSFMAEALTIVTSSVRNAFQSKGAEVMVPLLSQGQRIDRTFQSPPLPPDVTVSHFGLAGAMVSLTVSLQPCRTLTKTTRALSPADILVGAYPPPGAAEVPLLNNGTALNAHYIEKLRAFGDATAEAYPVPVIVPTPLARFFHNVSGR